jgi:uncharacterized membrane protein YfcA
MAGPNHELPAAGPADCDESRGMFGQEPFVLLVIALAVLLGGFVKGVVGIGLPIVSIAVLSSVIDAHFALGIIMFPLMFTNLWQMLRAGRPLAVIRRFWPLMASMLICIWVGTHLVTRLPGASLYGFIGAAVVLFTTANYFTPDWHLPARSERWAAPIAGALSGLLGGISTIWGPPLTMLFIMIRLPKEAFIQATGTIWFAASIPLLMGYRQNGILDDSTAVLSLAACLPSFVGQWVGTWVRARIEQESFRKVLLIVFFLIGLHLIRRALF